MRWSNEAPRVHHAARWRGGWVAARGERAADGDAGDWVLGRQHALRLEICCLAIEYGWAEGRSERFAEIAAEFVRRNVDIIVTGGGAVVVAKQATSSIPIVFALANDPVGIGLVASLSRLAATSLPCRNRRPILRASGSRG